MSILFLLPTMVYGLFLGLNQGMWHLTIISGLTMFVWILVKSKKAPQESQELEIGLAGVAVGGRRLSSWSIFWPTWLNLKLLRLLANPPATFYLDRFLDTHETLKAGIDYEGNPVTLKPIHTLVIGPTGSGKTELLRNLIESWPHKVVAIDFKGGIGFSKAFGIERLATNHSEDLEDFLNYVGSELQNREIQLGSGRRLQPMIFLIDEFASVVKESARAAELVEQVVSKGRALEMHLFASSQTLSGVSRTVLANCLQRVGIGQIDQVDAMQMGLSKNRRPSFGEGWSSAQLAEGQIYFSFPLGQSQISRVSQAKTVGFGDSKVIDLSRVRVQAKTK